MAYSLVRTPSGEFSIDWKTVYGIIRSHHRARLQLEHSKELTESQSPWYVPTLLGGMPDLWYVSVDWKQVEQAGFDAFVELAPMAYNIGSSSGNVDRLVERLRFAQLETRRFNANFEKRVRQASAKSFAAMESSLSTLDTALTSARWTRDISGSILIGAASLPAAAFGAAAGAGTLVTIGAAGTMMKTVAKYQDTGNIGVAAVEASANIIGTVIPVFPKVKSALGRLSPAVVDRVKVLISVTSDMAQAFIKGDSPGMAAAIGAAGFATGTAGDAVKRQLKQITASAAVPIAVKVGKDVSKKFAQAGVRSALGDSAPSKSDFEEAPGVADATITDDLLVKFAVVDMSRGIGRSWW